MKNILLSYFETVLSLEAFLLEINLKLNEQDTEKLKKILKHLSPIILAFDFKFKGPFKSIIDKRFTYEQLLYLCYLKINESKFSLHQNHMLKASFYSNSTNQNLNRNLNLNINLAQHEMEKKLLATENLSLCYFLNKVQTNDGVYWRQLYDIIGFSIMKYILMYSYLFRRINSSANFTNNYVQICGTKFSYIYKTLVSNKLKIDEKQLQENVALKFNKKALKELNTKPDIEIQLETNKQKSVNLKDVFQTQDELQNKDSQNQTSILFQLSKLGNQNLNKTSIMYDRNLGSKIAAKFIYSDPKLDLNQQTIRKIIDQFILKDLNFSELKCQSKLEEMKQILDKILLEFVTKHRSCPFKIFIDCYCKKETLQTTNDPKQGLKRKRDEFNPDPEPKPKETCLSANISSRNVYCFLRRSLMHSLGHCDKFKKKLDLSCALIGGRQNFDLLMKKIKQVISGLKYDSFKLNSLIHGIKLSRVSFLKPIECYRLKNLVFLSLIRWLFEDYLFMVIKANFYVTDTSRTNSEVFFYLKSDWKNILKNQLSNPVNKNYRKIYNLEKIKESDLIGYCSRFESHGAHLGRLLPKNVNNECRIISGCKAFNPCSKKTFNINYRFITLNNCLKWMINKDPSLIGFACRGHVEIHRRYSKFLKLNYLNRTVEACDGEAFKKWNFLKFDINKCFDSIDSKELAAYLNRLLQNELGLEYVFTLIKYSMFQIDIDNKQLKSKYDYLTLKHHFHEKGFLNGIADFISLMENNHSDRVTDFRIKNSHNGGVIYVPLWIHDRNIGFRKLNDSVKKCLEHVIIKIHDELYERINGILQGSICSRNFCDLFLGRIEKRLFYYDDDCSTKNFSGMRLCRSNDLVLRIVDDYLVISSNGDRLFKIKDLLKQEIGLNEKKTVLYLCNQTRAGSGLRNEHCNDLVDVVELEMEMENFSVEEFNFLANFSNNYFSWCGFNIDVNTLDIYFNYEKYFDDSASLNNRLNSNIDYKYAFIMFNVKFLRLFTSNVSILVIDSEANSFQSILRNFIDFFALSAIRFCVLSKLMPSQFLEHIKLQIKLVLNVCYWLNNKISLKLKCLIGKYFYSTFSLFKFLCLRTYVLILLKFGLSKHYRLVKLISVNLDKLNFLRCIKFNCENYFSQLNEMIEQQTKKFYDCKF